MGRDPGGELGRVGTVWSAEWAESPDVGGGKVVRFGGGGGGYLLRERAIMYCFGVQLNYILSMFNAPTGTLLRF